MSTPRSRRFPVTVTHLPVTRCQLCDRTLAYRPGTISEVLTEHYRRAHPEALGIPPRNGASAQRVGDPTADARRPKRVCPDLGPQARQQSRSVVNALDGERAKSRRYARLFEALVLRALACRIGRSVSGKDRVTGRGGFEWAAGSGGLPPGGRGQIVLPELEEGFLDAPGGRAADALVERERIP